MNVPASTVSFHYSPFTLTLLAEHSPRNAWNVRKRSETYSAMLDAESENLRTIKRGKRPTSKTPEGYIPPKERGEYVSPPHRSPLSASADFGTIPPMIVRAAIKRLRQGWYSFPGKGKNKGKRMFVFLDSLRSESTKDFGGLMPSCLVDSKHSIRRRLDRLPEVLNGWYINRMEWAKREKAKPDGMDYSDCSPMDGIGLAYAWLYRSLREAFYSHNKHRSDIEPYNRTRYVTGKFDTLLVLDSLVRKYTDRFTKSGEPIPTPNNLKWLVAKDILVGANQTANQKRGLSHKRTGATTTIDHRDTIAKRYNIDRRRVSLILAQATFTLRKMRDEYHKRPDPKNPLALALAKKPDLLASAD